MSKGMPSLLALLGLAAVAGYQNRDKLRDMIGDARSGGANRLPGQPARLEPVACWKRSARFSAPRVPVGTFRKA